MNKLRWLLALLLGGWLLPGAAGAQERSSITGQVVAEGTNQPLQGVRVAIPALNMSTATDERGRFQLSNVPYGTHTLRLQELVVTGYGEQVRGNLAGAVGSLKPDEAVPEAPVTSVNQVLQGQVAGVGVYQNSGTPGAANTER